MSDRPCLSVFMPVYNAAPYLAHSISSVLDQTFSDFEFLIVDDGSTDRSVEIIQRFQDPRIRLIRQENRGCYPARNRAIQESRGRFLANMDADDLSLPQRFEKQVAFLESDPEAVMVATRSWECDQHDTIRLPRPDLFPGLEDHSDPIVVSHDQIREGAPFTLPTILFRRDLVDRIGGYDPLLFFGADLDFVTRAAETGKVVCLPERLYVLRDLPTSISSTGRRIQQEILEILVEVNRRVQSGAPREFTELERGRLEELARLRKSLPRLSLRRKQAYYETRLSILYRVNGKFWEAARHAFRAAFLAPEHLFMDTKLVRNLMKVLLRNR